MRITRLYSGPDGESHFEDVDLPMQVGPTGRATGTEVLSARGIMFFDAGDSEYHKAPARQIVIVHRGETEVMVGDGTSRLFKAGDAFLAEDLTGRGHKSTAKDLCDIIVTLE